MDIAHEGNNALHASKHLAGKASDAADQAMQAARHVGGDVSAWVHRRPVETALLSAATACVITALAFWATRPD